jgi:imidazole glycerol-phosphate synthase subunit HisF
VEVLDVRKKTGLLVKCYEVCTHNGKNIHKVDPATLATTLQDAGADEIVLNSLDRDGKRAMRLRWPSSCAGL